jgi:hypothetical protein
MVKVLVATMVDAVFLKNVITFVGRVLTRPTFSTQSILWRSFFNQPIIQL